jgi:hypothetical protein
MYDPSSDAPFGAGGETDGAAPAAGGSVLTGQPAQNVSSIQGWYQQYLGRPATLQELNSHLANPGGLSAVQTLIQNSPEAQAFATSQRPKDPTDPTTTDPTQPPPTSQPPAGGGAITPYVPPSPYQGPPAFSYADFQAPTAEDVYSDPGVKTRFNMGTDALQHWAAAKGMLNTGGTAKALIDYGSELGSQEYGKLFDRRLQTYSANRGNAVQNYNENYQTQYKDPWDINYASQYVDPFKFNFDVKNSNFDQRYKLLGLF